jgi:hypothetical protein
MGFKEVFAKLFRKGGNGKVAKATKVNKGAAKASAKPVVKTAAKPVAKVAAKVAAKPAANKK